ncbi:phage tail protein (plasmid) [Pseudochrobactrum algeriensis]|uniref:phage tail protein n=1 Tax=Pseudochrobactrum algeriensis TaxID=2834768 RepID=UPI001BCE640A|nr:phage tail protein [Pseudochrobactrum algeriensis]QVQ35460.1 phage tail protein [Pseudochrobactrum algeriensis]QVQ42076.1 phage tail protein [Pseudochrobactrum algeriensis]QVQ42334.1 phage tail protein [Pseudochrobactrum algeriensis]
MKERSALLPSNMTFLEKSFSDALDRSPEISPGIVELRGLKFHPIDRVIPYLVAEYGLSEIAEYLPDLRTVISDGIKWQRLIGTPAAIHKALGWINHDGDIEEFPAKASKWWWFQIHLPFEVRNTDFVTPITHLVKASKPLRSEFARLTAGYDVRAFRLNKHRLNGDAGLNNWSGIKRSNAEPVLSLRVNRRQPVFALLDGGVVKRTQHISMIRPVVLGMPMRQQGAILLSGSARHIDLNNQATTPFRNAPFNNQPFGKPSLIVQRGQ